MHNIQPRLLILISHWTLWGHPSSEFAWSPDECMAAVKAAGFDAICLPPDTPGIKESLVRHGLEYGGAFNAVTVDQFAPLIQAALKIGGGPINCQLASHDTPVDHAIELATALMEESDKQGAEVHIEIHRNTCTETPEKASAIAEGVKRATGKYPRINFDFSHPAIVKHLEPKDYADRLFANVPLFQQSTLWHMRPFNGHHCQVPVTNGKGEFSPEYREIQPFIRQAFNHWLSGSRPGNALWVVPELGPCPGYGLSCFPTVWEDAIALGRDIQCIWREALSANAG